jgi:hypothetical protein
MRRTNPSKLTGETPMHGTGNVCMHESMRKDGTSWVLDETVKSLPARGQWTVPRSKYMPASPDLQAGNSRWGIFALRARHATTQQRAGAGDHRMQRLSFSAKRNEHTRQTDTIQHTKSDRSGRTTWRGYRLCFCLSMNNPTQLTLASNRSTTIPSIIE